MCFRLVEKGENLELLLNEESTDIQEMLKVINNIQVKENYTKADVKAKRRNLCCLLL